MSSTIYKTQKETHIFLQKRKEKMDDQTIEEIIENITFTSEELAEVHNVIEDWDSVVEEEMESIEEINAEMRASRNIYEEMLEYLKEVKERDERQKRLLLEMKDDFARENYVIHLYQRVGKDGIEE